MLTSRETITRINELWQRYKQHSFVYTEKNKVLEAFIELASTFEDAAFDNILQAICFRSLTSYSVLVQTLCNAKALSYNDMLAIRKERTKDITVSRMVTPNVDWILSDSKYLSLSSETLLTLCYLVEDSVKFFFIKEE